MALSVRKRAFDAFIIRRMRVKHYFVVRVSGITLKLNNLTHNTLMSSKRMTSMAVESLAQSISCIVEILRT